MALHCSFYFSGVLASTLLWISVIFLAVHIFVHTALQKLRNPPAQNLLALTCALCAAQFLTAAGLTYTTSHSICIFIATCLHYFYLVASFWMNVLHFDLCRVTFKRTILNKVSKLTSLLLSSCLF
jgi:G protein-coupled receptor Mth (Methuselah protein)